MLATVPERMGFGTRLADVTPYLPPGAHVVEVEDAGHFIHIERPKETAELVLEFLA